MSSSEDESPFVRLCRASDRAGVRTGEALNNAIKAHQRRGLRRGLQRIRAELEDALEVFGENYEAEGFTKQEAEELVAAIRKNAVNAVPPGYEDV